MAGLVEDFGELGHFSASERLKKSTDPAANTDRVGDIAKGEMDGLEPCVELAVKLLSTGGCGELSKLSHLVLERGADAQEFHTSAVPQQFTGHPGHGCPSALLSLTQQAFEGEFPPIVNDLSHLGHLTSGERPGGGSDGTDKPHRKDAVSDDEIAWSHAQTIDTVNFISGQTGDDRHPDFFVVTVQLPRLQRTGSEKEAFSSCQFREYLLGERQRVHHSRPRRSRENRFR